MTRLITTLIFVWAIFGAHTVTAQQEGQKVTGVVVDSKSLEPIQYVHVVKNDTLGTLTNEIGRFDLYANIADTLQFQFLGYKPFTFSLKDTLEQEEFYLTVFLIPDTLNLDEIVVSPFQKDKRSVLNEETAVQNVDIVKRQILSKAITDNDPYSIYQEYYTYKMIFPEGAVFFSTQSIKGIFSFINNQGKKD